MLTETSAYPIILFDGECKLCNRFVQFAIKRDRKDLFRFGSIQSEKAHQRLLQFARIKPDLATVILLDRQKIITKSDAALEIINKLSGAWRMLYVFKIVPKFLRDSFYRFIAKHRYSLFGRRESCMVPSLELLEKFI